MIITPSQFHPPPSSIYWTLNAYPQLEKADEGSFSRICCGGILRGDDAVGVLVIMRNDV